MLKSRDEEENKISSYKNFMYITGMINKASPHRLLIHILRKSVEGVYRVIFAVYLIQYIFSCLEEKTLFSKMFTKITWITLGYMLLNVIMVYHEYYQKKDKIILCE